MAKLAKFGAIPGKGGRHRRAKRAAKHAAALNGTPLEVEKAKSIEKLRIVT